MISVPPFRTAVIPFATKKDMIRYLTMDIAITGSMWHRVVEVGTGCKCVTIPLIPKIRNAARVKIRA